MADGTCTAEGCGRQGRVRRGLCDKHYQRWQRQNGIQHVSTRKCSVEGCERPHKTNGVCAMHYARWRYSGDLGPPELKNLPAPAECTVDGCTKPPAAKGLCSMHRARFLKYGDVNAGAFQPRGTCQIPDCDRPHAALGYCDKHYWRLTHSGDPERVLKPLPLGQLGYMGVHQRLRVTRGPAADNACHQCGGPAQQWAYDHTDPDARIDPRLGFPYSTDLARYLPMCARCHLAFDRRPDDS